METATRIDLGHGLSLRVNSWIPSCRFPLPKQALALALCDQGVDVLYGGAAGGGKTDALLLAALQYVDTPGYKAGIARRTYRQLNGPDGIIRRSHQWAQLGGWTQRGARWNGNDGLWTFPSGAVLYFGYLDHDTHKDNWQGHEFQFYGRDEVTQWGLEELSSYPETRLRRSEAQRLSGVPLRTFSTANPGGAGHQWVKRRWVDSADPARAYVHASVRDNPFLDAEDYLRRLRSQGELVYQRLGLGNWDAEQGEIFDRDWFRIISARAVPADVRWCHAIDPAASARTRADNTASGFVGIDPRGNVYVEDLQAWRAEWPESRRRLKERILARPVPVVIEGISGFKVAADDLKADPALVHVLIQTVGSKPDKVALALPWASRAQEGRVHLVDGSWVDAFLAEAVAFPEGAHDDRVDVVSLGVSYLGLGVGGSRMVLPPPPQRRERVF